MEEEMKGKAIYKDWIVRFYASHDDISESDCDGKLMRELVYCEDCKHKTLDPKSKVWECLYSDFIQPQHYCGYGEKNND